MKSIIVPAKVKQITSLNTFVEGFLQNIKISDDDKDNLFLVIEEIFVNIANYAYPQKNGNVELQIDFVEKKSIINLTFIDDGIPFNPLGKNNADFAFDNEQRELGGLGVFLIQNLVDDIFYENKNSQNIY